MITHDDDKSISLHIDTAMIDRCTVNRP
jgi:hypothetical protein